METQTLRFAVERQTKNTFRFAEVAGDNEPVVGTIYVQKEALGPTPPTELIVTIAAA